MRHRDKVCVIIPCFKVSEEIKNVLSEINYEIIDKVFVVDDACPENSGLAAKNFDNKKIDIIFSEKNLGVGGATMLGFKRAIDNNYDIIFKIDGDGQHNPKDISIFLDEFRDPKINFCKGSRFLNQQNKQKIPKIRLFGNIILTYMSRITCSNNKITDVVNGFLCIRSSLLKKIDLKMISKDFFFEEDLLFNISFYEKNIREIEIQTIYKKKSSLSPIKTILPFIFKHFRNYLIKKKNDYKK